ncbi:hypothetical protein [Mycoavidus sp. B2-EB]|uniref:hypothetical protein n=1 Tax=Mycoavidus sp. B2-EB TaxID=2651972 RepID=UPI0016298F7B|nr:hypothetical protein [Mycoavidus sp. B2-EB]
MSLNLQIRISSLLIDCILPINKLEKYSAKWLIELLLETRQPQAQRLTWSKFESKVTELWY